MLCNALIGVYFLIRGIQAVISILIGKVMSTYIVDIATLHRKLYDALILITIERLQAKVPADVTVTL